MWPRPWLLLTQVSEAELGRWTSWTGFSPGGESAFPREGDSLKRRRGDVKRRTACARSLRPRVGPARSRLGRLVHLLQQPPRHPSEKSDACDERSPKGPSLEIDALLQGALAPEHGGRVRFRGAHWNRLILRARHFRVEIGVAAIAGDERLNGVSRRLRVAAAV